MQNLTFQKGDILGSIRTKIGRMRIRREMVLDNAAKVTRREIWSSGCCCSLDNKTIFIERVNSASNMRMEQK